MGCVPVQNKAIFINKIYDDKSKLNFHIVLCFYSFDKFSIIGVGDYGPVKLIEFYLDL